MIKVKSFNKGFTLMEIIVVIIIISLMTGFAVPRLDSFLSSDKSKKGIRIFTGLMRELRLKAVKNGTDQILVVDPSADRFWVESGSEEKDKKSPGSDIDIAGAQISGLDYSSSEKVDIRFYKKGYNDPFTVTLKNRSDGSVFSIVGYPFLPSPEIYNKPYFFDSGF